MQSLLFFNYAKIFVTLQLVLLVKLPASIFFLNKASHVREVKY